jgi:23S rRNA-intervening sequence protein
MAFRFESLDIWHMARAYATSIYAVSAKFPHREDYGLTSQINAAVNLLILTSRRAPPKVTKHLTIIFKLLLVPLTRWLQQYS